MIIVVVVIVAGVYTFLYFDRIFLNGKLVQYLLIFINVAIPISSAVSIDHIIIIIIITRVTIITIISNMMVVMPDLRLLNICIIIVIIIIGV